MAAGGSSAKASPLARAMAAKDGTDLAKLAGTGSGGRIVADDVRSGVQATPVTPVPLPDGATRRPLEGLRKRVADNLARSVREKPHVTLHARVDAGALMDLRKALLPRIEDEVGVRVSPTDLIAWACGRALARCPWMNGHIDESGITTYAEAHVGLAVSLGTDGLVVPVLRNASTARIAHLAAERARVVALARDGKLGSGDLAGATFTITNLGNYGVDAFNPIIPPPQIAILGVGAIRDEVVARGGSAVVRPTMGLSLSFDHRAVDGAPAGEFLQTLSAILADPVRELG
ncbi:MAG: dihydrolipoamide acetyltransferase family protein [Armatimonadota bacterium]